MTIAPARRLGVSRDRDDRARPSAPSYYRPEDLDVLGDREYSLFRGLVHATAGINLGAGKRELLVGRLGRRLRELGLRSWSDYYALAAGPGGERELVHLIDLISTNETHFFREPDHFQYIVERLVPWWTQAAAAGTRTRSLRVWSAACSTGEEAFTIAMVLLAHLPDPPLWNIEIVASDISTRVLDRARQATWPLRKADEIPASYLKRFMLRGTGTSEGLMRAGDAVRDLVSFRRLNLIDGADRMGGRFDLIFCRNVLIYFDAPTKALVLDRMVHHLEPTGCLFVGHAEGLHGVSTGLVSIAPTVYALPGHPESRATGPRARGTHRTTAPHTV